MSIESALAGVALRALSHASELEEEFVTEYNAIAHGEGGVAKVQNIILGLTHLIDTLTKDAAAGGTAAAAGLVIPPAPETE